MNRRDIIRLSALASAGVALGSSAKGNTQNPPQPASGQANPNGRFAGKVVLITGATSGIGEATAKAFAMNGAKVVFCGRREILGAEVEKAIRAGGGEAKDIRTDVRESGQVEDLVKRCVEQYGRIDVAFNNAGVEAPPKALTDLSLDDWSNVIATNLTGLFISLREELRVMQEQGGGCIVNNASVGGHRGFAMIGPYGASKAGVIQLTRIAALENAEKNIRVNSISPGAVDTPMLHRALSSWGLQADAVAAGYPIKRLTTVEEMARTVMWLSSDEASAITGTDVDVTGGYLAR